mgnify:CR=1 FL=1
MNNRQTPLEKLISDKERIQRQCKRQEQKLNEDFSYIQENAGSLLLSGLSLSFPEQLTSTDKNKRQEHSSRNGWTTLHRFRGSPDYLSIAKGMIPIAWDLAQPFIMTWGIKKAKKWFSNLLIQEK